MTEFVNWSTLMTYGGSLAMVLLLTQFTKGIGFVDKIPTRIWSYFLAFIVLIIANYFTTGLSFDILAQTFFNAFIISIAANGTHGALQSVTGKNTDGELLIDMSDPQKDIYRLDVGSLEALSDKKTVTLKIKSEANLH